MDRNSSGRLSEKNLQRLEHLSSVNFFFEGRIKGVALPSLFLPESCHRKNQTLVSMSLYVMLLLQCSCLLKSIYLNSRLVKCVNQLLTYPMMNILAVYPGIPGLFIYSEKAKEEFLKFIQPKKHYSPNKKNMLNFDEKI